MSNNKQTAVEWLIDQLRQLAHNQSTHLGMGDIRVTQGMLDDFEEQAKEMEKQQTLRDYSHGVKDAITGINSVDCNRYYNTEYGKE